MVFENRLESAPGGETGILADPFNREFRAVMKVSDVLDTYIYAITFKATPNYGFSAAVGLFKSVINLFMLLLANFTVKKASGSGLFA